MDNEIAMRQGKASTTLHAARIYMTTAEKENRKLRCELDQLRGQVTELERRAEHYQRQALEADKARAFYQDKVKELNAHLASIIGGWAPERVTLSDA